MKKVLLTTMFGALFMTSSLSAKAQAGSVSGNVAVSAGVAFLSGVKTKGSTAVGGVKVTPAVAKNEAVADAAYVLDGTPGVAVGTKASAKISAATTDFKKKAGAVVELTAGGSYWCTDSFGIGLDLGFGVANAKIEDKTTGNRSKISNSFSIMPTATYYMTDNLVLNVGAGVAWTKVKDLDYVPEIYKNEVALTDRNVGNDANTAATFWAGDTYKGKFVTSDVKNGTGAGLDADKVGRVINALNAHNAAVIESNKSFKTKPCFTAKVSLAYVLGENSQVSLGYKYTGIKSKTKNGGNHQLKANMHTITATYAYHF